MPTFFWYALRLPNRTSPFFIISFSPIGATSAPQRETVNVPESRCSSPIYVSLSASVGFFFSVLFMAISVNLYLGINGTSRTSHLPDKLRLVYPMKRWWDSFTLFWFTIAYCRVVSTLWCPRSCCTCSIGIPLSIAMVASVLRNLCG